MSIVAANPAGGARPFQFLLPLFIAIFCGTLYSMLSEPERILWVPIAVSLTVFTAFFCRYLRAGAPLPLFNIGVFAGAFFLLYVIVPPLWLMLSGLSYSVLSDSQLYYYQPSPQEYVKVTWLYVGFYSTFCLVYALVCPSTPIPKVSVAALDRPTMFAFLLVSGVIVATCSVAALALGVEINPDFATNIDENYQKLLALPLVVRQLFGILIRLQLVAKLALIYYGTSQWQNRGWRYGTLALLAFTIAQNIIVQGERTDVFALVLAFLFCYHRYVRPFKAKLIIVAAPLMLALFLAAGLLRGGKQTAFGATLDKMDLVDLQSLAQLFFTMPTEFSVIFSGNFGLYQMQLHGEMHPSPWTVYAYEPLLLIPQQLLPFEKANPQQMYVDQTPVRPFPGYYMFGPIAQSIIGFGWIELVLRAALLALIFAFLHQKVLREPDRFWTNALYLYMLIFSYYAIRSTTFTFVYFIVFGFFPIYALTKMTRAILLRVSRASWLELSRRLNQIS